MEIDNLREGIKSQISDLQTKISDLQTKLNSYQKQKEVLDLLLGLKKIVTRRAEDEKVLNIDISKEGMIEFINLLSSSEYISGTKQTNYQIESALQKRTSFLIFYLALAQGTILELTFSESEYSGFDAKIDKQGNISSRSYTTQKDLTFKTENYEWFQMISIVNHTGNAVFRSIALEDYTKYNGKKVRDVLVPISINDLISRFCSQIQQPNEGIKL